MQHTCGLSPVCVSICCFKSLRVMNARPHVSHSKFFSPVCRLKICTQIYLVFIILLVVCLLARSGKVPESLVTQNICALGTMVRDIFFFHSQLNQSPCMILQVSHSAEGARTQHALIRQLTSVLPSVCC